MTDDLVVDPAMDDSIIPEEFTDEEWAFFSGWQPVTEVRRKDEAESSRVGRTIRATPMQCWFNARRVVQKLDDYADASYVEGIAILDGCLIIEHGWVCRRDGTLIDPTLLSECVAYFPGLEFLGRAGIEGFLGSPRGRKCNRSPFLYAFGWGGRYSPSFVAARERAFLHVRELLVLQQEVSQDA